MTTRIASILRSISVAEEKCEFIIRSVIVGMRIRSLRTPGPVDTTSLLRPASNRTGFSALALFARKTGEASVENG